MQSSAPWAQEAGLHADDLHGPAPGELGLMGTIPIYWGEADRFEDIVRTGGAPHWARAVIEAQFSLRPLDYLSADALAGQDYLLLAQPRGFSAQENVALDQWVRQGGRLLLFADPQMTGETRFALGDRRRPQDTILLSPILAHWGITLFFDENQSDSGEVREFAGIGLPVRRAGRFEQMDGGSNCRLTGDGLVAQCRLGSGFATILADAAMLDMVDPMAGSQEALAMLLQAVFGDCAGMHGPSMDVSYKIMEKQSVKLNFLCDFEDSEGAFAPH